jgi:hypothetical protein
MLPLVKAVAIALSSALIILTLEDLLILACKES